MAPADEHGPLRAYALDGARLLFDRATGWCARVEGRATAALRREAPRVLHVGLSSRCNLRCAYCHRARGLDERWSDDALVSWARYFADRGALELVFGEGEPLLWPGFTSLVRRIYEETPLSVGFTTNGTLLSPARLDELAGCYGQFRLSAHDDNEPLAKARALARAGARFGVNLLATPALVRDLEATLERYLDAGCDDLLLLSYNGPDAALHLDAAHDRALERALLRCYARHPARVSLKVSCCFGRRLPALPTHAPAGDCGAGDDFLVLDSAWRVRGCSFARGGVAARSPEEAFAAWRASRALRAGAGLRGCARDEQRLDEPGRDGDEPRERVTVYRAWASNNSSSYLLVGEFGDARRADRFVDELQALGARAAKSPRKTLWQLLGHESEAPTAGLGRSGEGFAWGWPPDIARRGRLVSVCEAPTLNYFDGVRDLLLLRRGRVLFEDMGGTTPWPQALLALGYAHGQEPLLRAAFPGPVALDGARAYRLAPRWDDAREDGPLRLFSAQLQGAAVVPAGGLALEGLDEALRSPIAARSERERAPRRELVALRPRGQSVELAAERVRALLASPATELPALGWRAPFRLPAVAGVHALPGRLVVEVRGGVNAALSWGLLQAARPSTFELLDGRALRLQLRFGPAPRVPASKKNPAPDAGALTAEGRALCAARERLLTQLERHVGPAVARGQGPVLAQREEGTPRELRALEAPVHDWVPLARLVARASAELGASALEARALPERPLARAVGAVQGAPREGGLARDDAE